MRLGPGLAAVTALLGAAAVLLLLWSPWDDGSPPLTQDAAVSAASSYMVERYGEESGCLSAQFVDTDNVWLVSCLSCPQDEPPAGPDTGATCSDASESHVVRVDGSTAQANEEP